MREIKFRAWDGEAMRYGGFSVHATAGKIEPLAGLSTVKEDSPLMQYTGLKDKNGKEIYEGDIVKPEYGAVGEVKFNRCWFWITNNTGDDNSDELLGNYTSNNIEIIGNIYENPELTGKPL